jgi:hypothetical protein
LRKAVEFELQQEAGRRAYGGAEGFGSNGWRDGVGRSNDIGHSRGGVAVSGNHLVGSPKDNGPYLPGELTAKIATYHKFLQSNERMAAEYLERQPERVRRAILGSGNEAV